MLANTLWISLPGHISLSPSNSAELYPSLLTSSTTQLDSIDKVCGAVNGILNQNVSTNISLTNQELPSANLPRNHDPSWRVLFFNVVKRAVVQKIHWHLACWKLEVELWQGFSSLSIVIYCDKSKHHGKKCHGLLSRSNTCIFKAYWVSLQHPTSKLFPFQITEIHASQTVVRLVWLVEQIASSAMANLLWWCFQRYAISGYK